MTDYYERPGGFASDGTPTYASATDRTAEREVAARLEEAWGCELRPFGHLSALDWFAVRDGRISGVLELKSRSHARGQFPTVFLNLRKWLALHLSAAGLGVPALFVVRWTDDLGWLPVGEIEGAALRVAGCSRRVKAVSDIEPVLEVPVAGFRLLKESRPGPLAPPAG